VTKLMRYERYLGNCYFSKYSTHYGNGVHPLQ
jgi:hypothetical protein